MSGRAGFVIGLLAAVAVGLALRLPRLNQRPMHADEAVHTVKFAELCQAGVYKYDPAEYHGPTLYYATFPALWLSGAPTFAQTQAAMYRLVPVAFGIGLILLLWLIADGIGRTAAIVAGGLTAISPALVFYSRYYIQETLLVFFTLLVIAAGWRYARTRRIGWALLAGTGAGLMHSTKETSVIALGALVLALIAYRLVTRVKLRAGRAIVFALFTAVVVSAAVFSGFFTNPRGALDSLKAYSTYAARAGGANHQHPWYYYLQLLTYTRAGGGPVWSEGLIVGLAVIGGIAAWRRGARTIPTSPSSAGTEPGRYGAEAFATCETPRLARFLVIYAVILWLAYSAIPYKTPWCLLGGLHALVLLAGVGGAALLQWNCARPLKAVIVLLLCVGAAQLGYQAWRGSFVDYANSRNPYVYSQTTPDVEDLASQLQEIAAASALGRTMLIKVIVPNPWPLPWYLRGFAQVGYWEIVPPEPDADVVLVSATLQPKLTGRLLSEYELSYYGLRRDEVLMEYVRRDLWQRFINHRTNVTTRPVPQGSALRD